MMSRFNDIAQIYDYKLSQLRDPQVWQNTLQLTSNFWRLNFCAAMLLTEQNPKAVMCGTLTLLIDKETRGREIRWKNPK